MISISEQELRKVAENEGYRSEILEKVYRLLDLLEAFMTVPFLKTRLALKGGVFAFAFQENEIEFLKCLRQEGEIRPELLSDDKDFCERVKQHPSLLWRVKQTNNSEILNNQAKDNQHEFV